MKKSVVNFRVIFYPFIAFMFGIIVARPLFSGNIEYIVVSLLALGIVLGYFIYLKWFKALVVILAFFLIGNGFYFIGEASFNNVKNWTGQVAVVGRITDEIQENDYSTTVVIDNVVINGENSKNLRLIVKNSTNGKLKTGQKIAFEGEIEKSKPFYIKQFNSKDYRSGVRYTATVDFSDIVLSPGYKLVDEVIRLDIKDLIYQNMNEENASIAYAVMFGDKSDLDGEVYTAYQKSGIIHVLTVSGLHVGFLVALFYGLLRKCGLNNILNLIISSIVLIFYAYLCSFSPSVVRAGIMAFCMMLARALNRKYDSLNALGLAGFVLCVIKPLYALDIGFLMSFFCVFAIVMLNPTLTKFFNIFFPEKISSLLSLSLSAQLGILPFIASMGGTINLISFAVNMIVVPIFGLLYPFLFMVCMLGTFMPFLGVLLTAVDFVLMIINKIATFFAHANLIIPLSPMGFALTVIFFFMLFLVGRYFMLDTLKKFSLWTMSFLSLVFVLCLTTLPINTTNMTTVSYLNSYGQMSVVISTKSGQTAVIGENTLLGRYKSEYDKNGLDVYFSYREIADEEVNNLSELGLFRFICCAKDVDQGGGNCENVQTDNIYTIGDVGFSFITYNDQQSDTSKVAGIVFLVDNHSIFVAYEKDLSYNSYISTIEKYSPEIVVAGGAGQLALNDDYTCITYSQTQGSDYNYQVHGNFALAFNGKSWIKRGLD